MPSLRQLQYLVAVEDKQHFGRAADSVNVTQPTLSQQIKELELRLGSKLVERGRPVRLTPIGRDIAARARRVLRDISEIKLIAERSKDGMAGTIRLGVSPTIGPYLMPYAVVRLHRDFPALKLYVREGIPADQLPELRNGNLDMMLAPLPVSGTDIHVEPLFQENLHLVGAPDHPLFGKPSLEFSDFVDQPLLSLDQRHPLYTQAANISERLGTEIQRDYEGTSLDSLRQMTGSGLGLAILPELYLKSETDGEGIVKRFNIGGWSEKRSIAALWREGTAFADSYAAIAELVANEARDILG